MLRGGQREDTSAANNPSDASWITHFFTSGMNGAEDSNREVTAIESTLLPVGKHWSKRDSTGLSPTKNDEL